MCAAHVVTAKNGPGFLGQAEKIPDKAGWLRFIQSGLLCATTATPGLRSLPKPGSPE